jgi:hypothetical protein
MLNACPSYHTLLNKPTSCDVTWPALVHGGAGSALLKKPDTVRDIITTLRRNLPAGGF